MVFLLPSWVAFDAVARSQLPSAQIGGKNRPALTPKMALSLVLLMLACLGLLQVARGRLEPLQFYLLLALMGCHSLRTTCAKRERYELVAIAEGLFAYSAAVFSFAALIGKTPWQVWIICLTPAFLAGSLRYVYYLTDHILPSAKPWSHLMPRFVVLALYLGPLVTGFMVVARQLGRHYALALLTLLFSRKAVAVLDKLSREPPSTKGRLASEQILTLQRSTLAMVIGFELALGLVSVIPARFLPF